MMVNLMRSNQRWLMIVVTALVLVSFLWFFSDRTHSDGASSDVVGKIYGRSLTVPDLQRTARELRVAAELGLTNLSGQEIFRGGDLNEAAINKLVLQHEAEANNIQPTDEEVARAEKQMAIFQGPNGEFDPGKMAQVMNDRLTPNGFSPSQLDELVRQDIQAGKLKQLVVAPVVVSPLEVRRAYEQRFAKTDASIIRFQKADYAATVAAPTEDEVKKYYDEQKDRFTQPERRKVEYVKFGLDEAQQKLAGKERIEATKPLADRAVQFLEQLVEQKDPAAPAAGDTTAAPDHFAAVAAANHLPVKQTAEFEENQPLTGEEQSIQGLARAAFKLTKNNLDSDVPLQSPAYGLPEAYYDLHLVAIVPERPLTLEEAKPKIIAAIKDERAAAALAAKAEEVRTKLADALKAGKTLADAAKEAGQTVQTVPAFSGAEPARGVAEAGAIAKTAEELSTGELSKFVPTEAGGMLVYVSGRQGIDEAKFDQAKERIATAMQREKGSYFFYEWLQQNREAAGIKLNNRMEG